MKKLDQSMLQTIRGGAYWLCFFSIPLYMAGHIGVVPANNSDGLLAMCMNT